MRCLSLKWFTMPQLRWNNNTLHNQLYKYGLSLYLESLQTNQISTRQEFHLLMNRDPRHHTHTKNHVLEHVYTFNPRYTIKIPLRLDNFKWFHQNFNSSKLSNLTRYLNGQFGHFKKFKWKIRLLHCVRNASITLGTKFHNF